MTNSSRIKHLQASDSASELMNQPQFLNVAEPHVFLSPIDIANQQLLLQQLLLQQQQQAMQFQNQEVLLALLSQPASQQLYPTGGGTNGVVLGPNGFIYQPRKITIFDVFPGIVEYQSKEFSERDRVDYLLSVSAKNQQLKVDAVEMWYTALKYLFNGNSLGPFNFDMMPAEMRYVLQKYLQSHQNRVMFFNCVKRSSFLHVIRNISKEMPKKLPKLTKNIETVVKAEQEAKKVKQPQVLLQHVQQSCVSPTACPAPFYHHLSTYPMAYGYGQAAQLPTPFIIADDNLDTMFAGWSPLVFSPSATEPAGFPGYSAIAKK